MSTITVTTLTVYNGADTEPADVHVIPGTPYDSEVIVEVDRILRDRDDSFGGVDDADLIEAMREDGWSITTEAHTIPVPAPVRPADCVYGVTFSADADVDPETVAKFVLPTLRTLAESSPRIEERLFVEVTLEIHTDPSQTFPCRIADVSKDGESVTIQRYLDDDDTPDGYPIVVPVEHVAHVVII